jgi:hypothetical protein
MRASRQCQLTLHQEQESPIPITDRGLAAFFYPGTAAGEATEVVGTGPADLTLACDLERVQERGADEEGPLYTNAIGNPSDRERDSGSGRIALAVSALQHNALESLDTLTIAFTNHHVDPYGIAGLELLDGVARCGVNQRSCFDHGYTSGADRGQFPETCAGP